MIKKTKSGYQVTSEKGKAPEQTNAQQKGRSQAPPHNR